jgi:hypothetical protein
MVFRIPHDIYPRPGSVQLLHEFHGFVQIVEAGHLHKLTIRELLKNRKHCLTSVLLARQIRGHNSNA